MSILWVFWRQGLHCVVQAGLELLGSSKCLSSLHYNHTCGTPQHCARQILLFLKRTMFIFSWWYFSDCWLGNTLGYPLQHDRKGIQNTGQLCTYVTGIIWAVTLYIWFIHPFSVIHNKNRRKASTIPIHNRTYRKSFSIYLFLVEKTILRHIVT